MVAFAYAGGQIMARSRWTHRDDAETRVEVVPVGSERYRELDALRASGQPLRELGGIWRIGRVDYFGNEAHFLLREAESFTE